MLIRYVLARPTPPVKPLILKSGKVSTNQHRDTTRQLYLQTCAEEGQEPNDDYVEALRLRDQEAWVFRYDMWCDEALLSSALYDAQHYQKAIASSSLLPPKNAFACDQCSWRSYCESDPMATNIEDWPSVIEGRQATPITIKYGRTKKALSRDRRGFVVSPSELRAFAKCNRLWAIEYRWRMRQTYEGVKALPRVRGSLVHEALRLLAKEPKTDLRTEISIMVKEMTERQDLSFEAFEELVADDGIAQMAQRASDMFAMAMEGVAEIVEYERRRIIKMPGSKKWLQGIPDAVVRLDNGNLAIIEYKTTKFKTLPSVADRYRTNPAVHLYAALVQFGQLTF